MIRRTKPARVKARSMQNQIDKLKRRGLKGKGAFSNDAFTLGFSIGFMS